METFSAALFSRLTHVQLIRDQFTISTWLCIGALFQSGLFMIIGRLALLPAVVVLLYRILDTYAMTVGFKEDIYMKDIIQNKFSAQIPDEVGQYGPKPADKPITVFIIGTRSNHPLGMLAPGFKELGGYFQTMAKDLDNKADDFGFLGMTSWLNSSVRATGSELQMVCYFKNVEGLHAFAHSELHRKAWDWWNRTLKQHPHLSIYHETYDVPKGNWESIYVNTHASGLASTTYKVIDEQSGKEVYASPIVDASRGVLRTSAGRMSRSKGEEHDGYGEDPY